MRRFDPGQYLVRAAGLLVCVSLAVACGGGGGGSTPAAFGLIDRASVNPSGEIAARTSNSGQFAADFLRRTNFTNLIVEIDHPVGRPPSPGVVQLLEQRLSERCDKPGGVTIIVDDAIPSSEFPPVSDVDDLDDLESAHRDMYADLGTQTVVMYILYVKGGSHLDGSTTHVVGLSYRGSSVACFVDAADQGNNQLVTTAEVEGATLVHELGHQLGLVNTGVPMVQPHQDPDHGAHDIESSCVMYWLINVPLVSPNLGDDAFAQFDPLCVADLRAVGGLGPDPARISTQSLLAPSEAVAVGSCGCCAARPHAHAPTRAPLRTRATAPARR